MSLASREKLLAKSEQDKIERDIICRQRAKRKDDSDMPQQKAKSKGLVKELGRNLKARGSKDYLLVLERRERRNNI